MTHTPGPWMHIPAGRSGYAICAPSTGSVVTTADEDGRYGVIDSEQDALLIAAAPEMLEALKAALPHIESVIVAGKVRDAIANATGRGQ
jgi:hypothetical protein